MGKKKPGDSTNVTQLKSRTFNTGPEGEVRVEPVGEDISCGNRPL